MARVRWGILSTAKIGTVKVIPAMQQGKYSEIVAIASRDSKAAAEAAKQLNIPRWYGSYEELLADPDVDAIYNPLPNHLHVPWSIRALEAGKHVLCEKPIGLTSDEGRELVAAARRYPKLKVMEAFMYRHHPQWRITKEMVDSKKIGTLTTIQSFFSYYNVNANDIRNQKAAGGGGLLDIGCYPISLSRFLFNAEPKRVIGIVDYDSKFATDHIASAIMDFGNGTATFTCSTQLAPYQRVHVFGEKGRIEIEIPFNAPVDRPCKVWLQLGDQVELIPLQTSDQYTVQGDLFSQAVLEDTPVPTPIEDAVGNMLVIEAIARSGKSGHWEKL